MSTHYHVTVISTYHLDGEPNHDHIGQYDNISLDEAIAHAGRLVRLADHESAVAINVFACDGECTYPSPFQTDENGAVIDYTTGPLLTGPAR